MRDIFSYVLLAAIVVSVLGIVLMVVNHWRYMKRMTREYTQHTRKLAYDLGRTTGEEIGAKRGYRLAMRHYALSVAGRKINPEEIP